MIKRNATLKSFSLIEISIAFTVVAILIGAALSGKKIVNRAKIDSIMTDAITISKAVQNFKDKYGSLPGDNANTNQLNTVISGSLVAGDGNGMLDTATEQQQFWCHLAAAGLLKGNFSCTSSSVAYTKLPNTVFSISGGSTGLLLSLYPTSGTGPVLTPEEAYYLDKKYDNGLPSSGLIKAYDGTGVAAGSCVSGGAYNLNYKNKACYITIDIENKEQNSTTGATTCSGSENGNTRTARTAVCPMGYVGKVIEKCVSGSWQVSSYNCEIVKCQGGIPVGATVNLPCNNGYSATMQYTCQATGILMPTGSATSCQPPSGTIACNNPYTTRPIGRFFACPPGYVGMFIQFCPRGGGTWTNVATKICTIASISGYNLGAYSGSSNGGYANCSTANTAYVAASGGVSVKNTAAMLSTSTSLVTQPVYTNCGVEYPTGCTPGNTVTFNCPFGQMGSVTLLCNSSGNYEESSNTCRKSACGDDPVGSFRSTQIPCPEGYVGTLLEICDYVDSNYNNVGWKLSNALCYKKFCIWGSLFDMNSALECNWLAQPATDAGSYSNNGAASRYCDYTGNWVDC